MPGVGLRILACVGPAQDSAFENDLGCCVGRM